MNYANRQNELQQTLSNLEMEAHQKIKTFFESRGVGFQIILPKEYLGKSSITVAGGECLEVLIRRIALKDSDMGNLQPAILCDDEDNDPEWLSLYDAIHLAPWLWDCIVGIRNLPAEDPIPFDNSVGAQHLRETIAALAASVYADVGWAIKFEEYLGDGYGWLEKMCHLTEWGEEFEKMHPPRGGEECWVGEWYTAIDNFIAGKLEMKQSYNNTTDQQDLYQNIGKACAIMYGTPQAMDALQKTIASQSRGSIGDLDAIIEWAIEFTRIHYNDKDWIDKDWDDTLTIFLEDKVYSLPVMPPTEGL